MGDKRAVVWFRGGNAKLGGAFELLGASDKSILWDEYRSTSTCDLGLTLRFLLLSVCSLEEIV